MDFSGIRVLVTDGAGKQPLAMVRGLKEIGCHITVLCSSKWDSCYVSNKPDKKILDRRLFEDNADAFSHEEKFEHIKTSITECVNSKVNCMQASSSTREHQGKEREEDGHTSLRVAAQRSHPAAAAR